MLFSRPGVVELRPVTERSALTIARPGVWALAANAAALILAWLIVDCVYHVSVHGFVRDLPDASRTGVLLAICYVTIHTLRRAPRLWSSANWLDAARQSIKSWNLAVVAALVLSVLTRDVGALARAPLFWDMPEACSVW